MSWWVYLWLAVVASLLSVWVFGPPFPNAGLLLWYVYDTFPVEKPIWLTTKMETWLVKHPKDEYVTLHGSVLNRIVTDIVQCVREHGWTDDDVHEAIKGAFSTAHRAGGTIQDVDHFAELLGAVPQGAPDEATKH